MFRFRQIIHTLQQLSAVYLCAPYVAATPIVVANIPFNEFPYLIRRHSPFKIRYSCDQLLKFFIIDQFYHLLRVGICSRAFYPFLESREKARSLDQYLYQRLISAAI